MTDGQRRGRKIRVGVLFGGQSNEHAVSIASARSVIAALDPAAYEVVPIGITRGGQWLTGGDPMGQLLAAGGQLTDKPPDMSNDTAIVPSAGGPESAAGDLRRLDVVFPVLHGPLGEDGTIQGLLELAGIAYVGSGVLASAMSMDKAAMKAILRDAGLPTPRTLLVTRREWEREPDAVRQQIVATLGLPCFVKPANMGSSVGVSKAHDASEIAPALADAFAYDPTHRRAVVEEAILGREVECSVLGNDEPEASAVGEIVLGGQHEFYDYEAKYTDAATRLVIPADLPPHVRETVRQYAVRVFKAVDAAGLARVDFFYDEANERVLVNEINTIPGFTATSMYAMMWEAVGVSYGELVDRLIRLAMERHAESHHSYHGGA